MAKKKIKPAPTGKEKKSSKKAKIVAEKTEETKVKVKPKKKIKTSKGHLFHVIQHELSIYTKANNIKLGKKFQSHASDIYQKVKEKIAEKGFKGSPKKFAKDNIEALFKKTTDLNQELSQERKIISKNRVFIETIKFYMVFEEFVKPQYLDVTIIFNSFNDGIIDFPMHEFESGTVFADWFERNLKPHCRSYYNASPVAVLVYKGQNDEENYVEYELQVGEVTVVHPPAIVQEPILPTPPPILPPSDTQQPKGKLSDLQAKIDIYIKRKQDLREDIKFFREEKMDEALKEAQAEYLATDKKIKSLLEQIDKL